MSTVEWPARYRPLPIGYTVELCGGTHYAVVFADREVSEIHWDKYTVRRWAFQIAADSTLMCMKRQTMMGSVQEGRKYE